MATIELKNNVVGFLSTAISASDVGVALQAGDGAEFPAIAGDQFFYATISSTLGTYEIVKVTARSVDSLTIVRAQEGTSAASFAAGARIEMRITAQSIFDAIKLDTILSVKDFGAIGDGVTDDTAAIQAAIAATSSIRFTPGTYLITADITIPAGECLVFDNGAAVTASSPFNLNLNNNAILIADRYRIFTGSASATNIKVVFPEWWGATHSATGSQNTAFQAALDALKLNGSLLLNNGFYSLDGTTPLDITKGQSISGYGMYQTTIRVSTAAVNVFRIADAIGAVIQDLRIQVVGTPSSGNAIFVDQPVGTSCGRFQLRNLWLENVFNGMYLLGNSTSTINTGYISNINVRVVRGYVARYEWCENIYTTRLLANAQGGVNTVTGALNGGIILFNKCQSVDFSDCQVSNCYTAALLTSNSLGIISRDNDVRWCFFSNCVFDDSEFAIRLNLCSDMRFINCWATSSGRSLRGFAGDGVEIGAQTEGVTFIGGMFSNNGQRAFRILNGADGVTIRNALMVNNSINDSTVNPFWAIDALAGTSNFAITGCTVRGTAYGLTGGYSRGIQVRVGTSNNYIISGNQISTVFDNDYLNDAGTGTNKVVADNLTWA